MGQVGVFPDVHERGGVGDRRARAAIIGQQIEIRARILCEAKRPVRAVHKALGADRAQQVREVVFRGTPDPREVPEHAPLLVRREAPVGLLEQLTTGAGHDEPHRVARPRERRGRAQR